MSDKKIMVTQPTLPKLNEFVECLKDIWESRSLTNNGKFHQQFEKELATFLGVKYISLFSNGTLALICAMRALKLEGEVITTPYSFVATTHALWWNGIKPIFVDIDPNDCNLDPRKIEAAITKKTTAILPVHVYGNPCNMEKIQQIANKHHLKVIYDAAHAFGVKKGNASILNFGDLSILSFHATKPFNTFEGGAIVSHDKKTKKHIDYLKNFGFDGETTVIGPGINAKMNELQAACGLLQLKTFNANIEKRKKIAYLYRNLLSNVHGIHFLEDVKNVKHNYAYFPIFIDEANYGITRDELYEKLKKNNIYGRRYFYPLISKFPPYNNLKSAQTKNLTVAEKAADQVICLPIYPDLNLMIIKKIVKTIKTK